MPLPNATDLGEFEGVKKTLARAQEQNERMEAERIRLIGAINHAVSLLCILIVGASLALVGLPEQQRIDRANQEQIHASR